MYQSTAERYVEPAAAIRRGGRLVPGPELCEGDEGAGCAEREGRGDGRRGGEERDNGGGRGADRGDHTGGQTSQAVVLLMLRESTINLTNIPLEECDVVQKEQTLFRADWRRSIVILIITYCNHDYY